MRTPPGSVIYRSDRATVLLGDARDVLAELDTESVDLIVTDPPYGVEWKSGRRAESFELLAGDGAVDRAGVREVITECVRVVGQNRHLYVFGPTDVLDGQKVGRAVALVWDKVALGSGDVTAAWSPNHEPITFAVSKHNHRGEVGRDSVPARLRKGAIIRATRPTGRKVRHPSEKPVPLLAELVESSSRAGELVVDPFAGVGSTGVAALLRGRRALLVELDEGYARIAAERLRATEELVERMATL